ncbi:Flp pilus assembly protein TadB [Rubrivivax gelatinosus]|nr:hypothetical protein [Rubrivivax gelatinosus]MBG6081156.1 Flp pilus assembly protein TadB [Rubrivivax gelatinosus]
MDPEIARRAGDALIEDARQRRLAEREARAPRLPWVYRVDDIERLSRVEQAERLEAARREVTRSPADIAVTFAALAVIVGAAFWAGASGLSWLMLGLGAPVPLRMLLVRRALRRQLARAADEVSPAR